MSHVFINENGYKNKETLEFYYNELNYTMTKIAEKLKCGYGTIRRWMIKHNIPIKPTSEWNKGRITSEDIKKKISNSLKGKNLGEKNGLWKGDNVGIIALHDWVKRYKPKTKICEICKINNPYDLANISGEYKRDINDFQWLCRKCHMISDNRMNNRDKKGRFK